MNRRVVLPALLVSLALAHQAHGAEPPAGSPATAPLGFATETLSTTCAKLADGEPVVVVNRTIEQLPVFLRWGLFREQSSNALTSPGSICGGLAGFPQSTDASPVVERGGTQTVELLLAETAAPPRGGKKQFGGTISVYSTSGIASTMTVAIAESEATTAPAKPLQESVSDAEVTRLDWHKPEPEWSDPSTWLPVSRVPRARHYVTVWIPVESLSPGKSIGGLELDQVVGAVAGSENRSARVTFVRESRGGGGSRVGLHVGALPPGTYEGKVDMNGETAGGELSLELAVKDPINAAALAILLSLAAAVLLQRLLTVVLPRRQLGHEIDALAARVGDAETAFREEDQNLWPAVTFSASDEQQKLRKKLDDKTRWALLQIDQKVIDGLRSDIEVVAATIDKLPALAGKIRAARKLLSKQPLDSIPDVMPEDPEQEPLLARTARALTEQPPSAGPESTVTMQLSEVDDRKTELDDAVKDAKTLVDAELHLASLVDDWNTLDRELPEDNEEARTALPGLWDGLVGVWHQIWNAGTAGQLEDYGDEIGKIDNEIAKLWPQLDDPRERVLCLLATQRRFAEAQGAYEAVDVAEPPLDVADVVYPFDEPGSSLREVLRSASGPRLLFTNALILLALLAAVGLAVLAGLTALYKDEPFGDPWDYVAAITYGLVLPSAIVGVTAVVNKLGEAAAVRGLRR